MCHNCCVLFGQQSIDGNSEDMVATSPQERPRIWKVGETFEAGLMHYQKCNTLLETDSGIRLTTKPSSLGAVVKMECW